MKAEVEEPTELSTNFVARHAEKSAVLPQYSLTSNGSLLNMIQYTPINLVKIIGVFIWNEVTELKINESGRVNGISSYQRNIENRDHAVDKKKRQVDQVSISAEAKGLLEVQNLASPERLSRIAELKESVSTGTYHVDAKQIAEKMFPYFKSIIESGDVK